MSVSGELLELTILMPCLDAARTIASCVRKARGYLESHGLRGEVLVADHGSTDGSQELAQACGARVIEIDARGYGAALLVGIQAARGRYIIMGDADEGYDFSALDPFLGKLRAGYELVMGNRFLGGIRPHAMPPLHRYLGSPMLSGIGRLLFQITSGDFHCGLRAFRRESILSLGLTSSGMEFASEMVVKATLRKLRMTEVPTVVLSPDGRARPAQPGSWRDGWRHLRFLLLFSPASLFFYPGLTLLLLGTACMAWMLPHTQTAAGISYDATSLVFAAAAIVCGFQAVVFYVFAKTYAVRSGLLPKDMLVERLRNALRLEVGLIAGLICVAAGLALAAGALTLWGRSVSEPSHLAQSLRVVVPSATLLMLGLQVVFSSCLLGVLQLDARTSYTRTRRSDRSRAQPASEAMPGPDSYIH
jgi:glycosyltransferase involved in cell wall biosynthesis